jgi:hypothetical protein
MDILHLWEIPKCYSGRAIAPPFYAFTAYKKEESDRLRRERTERRLKTRASWKRRRGR